MVKYHGWIISIRFVKLLYVINVSIFDIFKSFKRQTIKNSRLQKINLATDVSNQINDVNKFGYNQKFRWI